LELLASALKNLAEIVLWVSVGVAALLGLRVVVSWLGANPFSWVVFNLTRLTEPLVRPLRAAFSGRYSRFDLLPMIAAVLVLMNGFFIEAVLNQLASVIDALGRNARLGSFALRDVASESIKLVGLLYVVAIFLRFFLPYFGVGFRSRLMRFLYAITEPLLKPLRKPLNRLLGATPFDFTALVAVFIVWVLTGILADLARGLM
jgi:uncharacterized protein YggT (Ycf19 family)